MIDPSELLERHQSLLEGNFTELGKGLSSVQKQWVCSMEAAVATAEYVKSGRPIYGEPGDYSRSEVCSARLQHAVSGSFVYRRCRGIQV